MATKNYMINDKWLDLDKQNIVELQSVDGVLDSMKVNGSEIVTPSGKITITENGTDIDIAQYALADVNVEGGGGSSDFSTAEVDVTVNTEAFYLTNAVGVDDEEMYWVDGFETMPYTLLLYKGTFESGVAAPEGYQISSAIGTGGVSVSTTPFGGNKKVTITGDGTLTVELTEA